MLQSFRAPPQSTAAEFQRPRTANTQKMSTAAESAPDAPRQRSQYSLYDDIRCTGDGEPPQCDLPMEVVCNIFDYANFTCAMSARRVLDDRPPLRHRRDARKTQVREEALPLDDQGRVEAHVPLQPRLLQGDVHLPVVCS